jgi:hypothetical protein
MHHDDIRSTLVPETTINPLTLVTQNNFGLWMILEMINVVVVLQNMVVNFP